MHRAKITAGRNWEPAETYAEARAIVANLEIKGFIKKGERTNCGLCQPELGHRPAIGSSLPDEPPPRSAR
jgi:hypothetical protein